MEDSSVATLAPRGADWTAGSSGAHVHPEKKPRGNGAKSTAATQLKVRPLSDTDLSPRVAILNSRPPSL